MLSGAKLMQAALRMRKNDTQIGNVQIGNVEMSILEMSILENVHIGNVQIGNVYIGNVKIVNTEIGRMEWPFSVTVLVEESVHYTVEVCTSLETVPSLSTR